MKLFFRYLRSKKKTLRLFFLFAALLAAAFFLYRLPTAAVLYPTALCALIGAAALTVDYFRTKKKHEELERLKGLKAELLDSFPPDDTIPEEDYRELLLSLKREIAELRTSDAARFRETVEYYTVWAHQIKTPIASIKLALENEDSELARRLSADLVRTQQYVEMAMTFLRLDSESTDYVFRKVDLDTLIRPAVRKFASEFIGRRLSLDYQPLGTEVVTDEKWFSFVFEQLLSNALKYTKEGGVRLYMEDGCLCIADTGIGIAPEDLPRIFEKGYTGCNGRYDRAASGIGLYLCRRVCKALGVGLTVESEVGKGTTARLRFGQSV